MENRFVDSDRDKSRLVLLVSKFLLAKLNTVEKQTFLALTMLKTLDFMQFYMINNE